jgi:hypothetical protein
MVKGEAALKPECVLLTFHRGDDRTEFKKQWEEVIKFIS